MLDTLDDLMNAYDTPASLVAVIVVALVVYALMDLKHRAQQGDE